jgi:hypothetical protein
MPGQLPLLLIASKEATSSTWHCGYVMKLGTASTGVGVPRDEYLVQRQIVAVAVLFTRL